MHDTLTERAADDRLPTPPSTTDYLQFQALHRPAAIALINNGLHISYAEFYRDVTKFTRAMSELDLSRGSSAAIEADNLYLHWLLLLACENLGIATASFLPGEPPDSRLLACMDLVLCRQDLPDSSGRRIHKLSQAWLDQVQAQPTKTEDARRIRLALGEIQRIKRSSGSTGFPKVMAATRFTEETALQSYMLHEQFTRDSRFLITGQFTVNNIYGRSTTCMRLGATCIFDSRLGIADAIVAYEPTHVRLFQYQVKPILERLPPTYSKQRKLTVIMGAGPLSGELRQSLLARLATDIAYSYSSNETRMIAAIDAAGLATARPGIEVEVVDEKDDRVPFGQLGQIKIKSDALFTRYIGEACADEARPEGGWFYTGDAGIMIRPRQFKVVGRIDEVLNIGGMKMSPLFVEEEIVKESPVAILETGVTSVVNPEGIEEICVAVVVAEGTDLKRLEEWLMTKYWLGKLHFAVVDQIPRTESGKVQRHRLRAMFEKQLTVAFS